jgi:hypothetical protein
MVGDLRRHPTMTVREVANSKPITGSHPTFGDKTFVSVITQLIAQGTGDHRLWPVMLTLARDNMRPSITANLTPTASGPTKVEYVHRVASPLPGPKLYVEAVLPGGVLLELRRRLTTNATELLEEE